MLLIIFHKKAQAERGFSFNSNVLVENIDEDV